MLRPGVGWSLQSVRSDRSGVDGQIEDGMLLVDGLV